MTKLYGPGPSLLIIGLACFLLGCDSSGKIHVQGTATWNGSPIEKGYVELQPIDGQGQFASAEITDGTFTLTTLPGKRRVKVTAEKKIGETEPTERIPEPEPIMFQFLPPKFNSDSSLEMEISASDPSLDIELNGEELKPATKPTAQEQQRKRQQGGGV